MKSMRSFFFVLTAALLGSLFIGGCGGGGGSSSGSGGGGVGGGGSTGGETPPDGSFEAPGNRDLIGNNLIFTFSDGETLEFVPTDEELDVIPDLRGSGDYQVLYRSGKFGGQNDSKTGDFRLERTGSGSPSYVVDVLWTSPTEAALTGNFRTNKLDPSTGTPITGSLVMLVNE